MRTVGLAWAFGLGLFLISGLPIALPIHEDVRFGAWAALGDFGRTGSFGFLHRVTTDTFANALEG